MQIVQNPPIVNVCYTHPSPSTLQIFGLPSNFCQSIDDDLLQEALAEAIAGSQSRNHPLGDGLDLPGLGTFGLVRTAAAVEVVFNGLGDRLADTAAYFHFIDDWQSESAYLKVDDHVRNYRGFQEFLDQPQFIGRVTEGRATSDTVLEHMKALLSSPLYKQLNHVLGDAGPAVAKKALTTFIHGVGGALKKGDRVALVGFGSFSVSKRAARTGRNPHTGKEIKIAAKNVVRFKAGADLSKKVN